MTIIQSIWTPILLYIIILLLIIACKPTLIYDDQKKRFKEFGIDKGKSLLSLPILAILLAIIIYIVYSYIDRFLQLKQKYESKLSKVQQSSDSSSIIEVKRIRTRSK